jgi:hypothetical protein
LSCGSSNTVEESWFELDSPTVIAERGLQIVKGMKRFAGSWRRTELERR